MKGHYQEVCVYDISFFKKSIFIILLSLGSFASEVIWQDSSYSTEHKDTSNPLKAIQQDIVSQIKSYLKQREPIDVRAIIPPKIKEKPYPKAIPKPQKPKDIILIRNEFESLKAFQLRQERERDIAQKRYEELISDYNEKVKIRRNIIIEQNRQYNEKVKQRNREIEKAKKIREKDIAYLKEDYIRRQHKINQILPNFASKSFFKYLGNPKVVYERYDYKNQSLQLKILSQYNNFQKSIQIKLDATEAQNIKKYNSLAKAKIFYKLNLNKKNHSLSLLFDRFEIEYNDNRYLASIVSSNQNLQPLEKVIITTNSNHIIASNSTPQKQSIKQEDYDPVETSIPPSPIYIITTDNEILEKLKSIAEVDKDPKKWLFVIGAEEYDNTDNVPYSKRSAEAFVKVAQKSLGVTERNSYTLIGDKATSGAIEDKLIRMLDNIKEGDSIYFFYSGHGIPVLPDRVPYLLPKDNIPDYIARNPFFKLENIYNLLLNSKASKIIAIMDCCFSGATDGVSIIKGVAGSVLVPKKIVLNSSDRIVILTAGRDKQFSNMYPSKRYRLFSYFIMKSLLEGKRNVRDIYNTVYPKVKSISNGFGDLKRQEPTIEGNKELSF